MHFFKPNVERMRSYGNIEGLIKALYYKGDYWVRKSASRALAEIGAPVVERLVRVLDDSDTNARIVVSWALSEIRDPWEEPLRDLAVPKLIACLNDPEKAVRQNAAWSLGKIGDERAVMPLITCLNDPEEAVRQNAAYGLAELAEKHAGSSTCTPAVNPLIDCLRDEYDPVRQNAVWGLAWIADNRATEPLIACLDDSFEKVRQNAARGLGRIGNPEAVAALVVALRRDESIPVRTNAARALARSGDPRAMSALLDAKMDRNEQVREAAAEALEELGSLAEESPLSEVTLLREVEVETDAQTEAEEANAEIRSLIQKLSLKPRDQLELMHPEKMQSMSEIGKLEQNAVKPLLEALDGVDMEARATIVSLLGQLKDKRAVLPIAKQLQHSSPMVRFEAAVALGKYSAQEIQKAQVEEYLKQASNDADIDVRNKAKEILNRLGIQVSDSPWFTGANTWERLVKAFIHLELPKPSSDYQGFTQRIQNFSAAERHGAWIRVAQEAESKTDTIRCYLEALHNDPDPRSVAWGWLSGQYNKNINALPPGSPKTLEVVDKLRRQYGPISGR